MALDAGDAAPAFTLPDDIGGEVSLADFKGTKLVLYFYPRDDTPGCTKEAIAFTEHLDAFKAADTAVLGVSKDTVAKHGKFRAKHNLGIPLASDAEATVCEDYGVWVEKNMYGRKSMGIERATFLIDREGKVARVWRKVKVPGHAEAVLDAAKALD
ncbi:thioredoxin-dependent thiol peroxidase [Rhodothalassium salexigens]|uniref:thioredoxin-dependent thiol peroxidase n=1 Tax=Rhodothalassium salexigens TaxID=1086 RepID=UPI00191463BB|nr:thioredoxin-dependent thiol peroxidase [Rhodothalassium salexigens]MBK5911612.1 thioredoxin-dependent thiol peroxidase [Rhodothalassium salexigens]MBK5920905.1 thioredoxin-dependent thiol peroxidase [Rhodothalassium salexigens]